MKIGGLVFASLVYLSLPSGCEPVVMSGEEELSIILKTVLRFETDKIIKYQNDTCLVSENQLYMIFTGLSYNDPFMKETLAFVRKDLDEQYQEILVAADAYRHITETILRENNIYFQIPTNIKEVDAQFRDKQHFNYIQVHRIFANAKRNRCFYLAIGVDCTGYPAYTEIVFLKKNKSSWDVEYVQPFG